WTADRSAVREKSGADVAGTAKLNTAWQTRSAHATGSLPGPSVGAGAGSGAGEPPTVVVHPAASTAAAASIPISAGPRRNERVMPSTPDLTCDLLAAGRLLARPGQLGVELQVGHRARRAREPFHRLDSGRHLALQLLPVGDVDPLDAGPRVPERRLHRLQAAAQLAHDLVAAIDRRGPGRLHAV